MGDIDKIMQEVDSSMAMEGMGLTNEDRARIRGCLADPSTIEDVIHMLLQKYTVPA